MADVTELDTRLRLALLGKWIDSGLVTLQVSERITTPLGAVLPNICWYKIRGVEERFGPLPVVDKEFIIARMALAIQAQGL